MSGYFKATPRMGLSAILAILVVHLSGTSARAKGAWRSGGEDVLKGKELPTDRDFQAFVKWARDNGVVMDGLLAKNYSEKGVGLFTTRSFEKGESLVSCPVHLLITPGGALESRMAVLFREANIPDCRTGNDGHCTAFLAMHLIHTMRNKTTHLAPWLRILPRELGSTVMWSEEELEELEGSNAHSIAVAWRDHIKSVHQDVVPPLRYRHPNEITKKGYSLEVFTWAYMLLYSRAFDVAKAGSTEVTRTRGGSKLQRIMGPIVDLLNHGGTPGLPAPYRFVEASDDKGASFDIVTHEGITAGQEALVHYDSKNNADYLLQYGFVLENNPQDYVGILANLPPDAPNRTMKVNMLRNTLSIDMDTHKHKMSKLGLEKPSLAALRVLCASQHSLASGAALRAAENMDKHMDVRNELCVYETLIHAMEIMISNYPTKLDEDLTLLRDMRRKGVGNKRYHNALVLRIGEKRILDENLRRAVHMYGVLVKKDLKEREMASVPSAFPHRQTPPMSLEEIEQTGGDMSKLHTHVTRGLHGLTMTGGGKKDTIGPEPEPIAKVHGPKYYPAGFHGPMPDPEL